MLILFTAGIYPSFCSQAQACLAEIGDLRRELGERARTWAQENLSMERILDQIDNLYEECVKNM